MAASGEDTRKCSNCGDNIPIAAGMCDTCGAEQKSAAPSVAAGVPGLDVGDVLGNRYEIRGVQADGTLGTVYKVHDREIGVTLALKIVRPDLIQGEEARKALRGAIKRARKFLHKNVVKLYETGEDDGHFYYTTEFVGGISLRKLIQARQDARQQFSLQEARPILEQLAAVVDQAHAQGIRHGNLRPENVLILPEGLKVIEFGVVTFLPPEKLWRLQENSPSLRYLAPEHKSGGQISTRADVFSAGVILFEMLAGSAPGRDGTLASEINEKIPAAIDDLLQRCLEEDPKKRPAGLGEMVQALVDVTGAAPEPRKAMPVVEEAQPLVEPPSRAPSPARKPPEPPPARPVHFPGEQSLEQAAAAAVLPPAARTAARAKPPPGAVPRESGVRPVPFPRDEVYGAAAAKKGAPVGLIVGAVLAVAALIGGAFVLGLFGSRGEAPAPRAAAPAQPVEAPAPAPPVPPPAQVIEAEPLQAAPVEAPPAPPPTKKEETARARGEARKEQEAKRQEEAGRRDEEREQREAEEAGRRAEDAKKKAAAKVAAASAGRCGEGMVEIKGGEFKMGSAANDLARDTWEQKLVPTPLKAYCIDRFEFPSKNGELPRGSVSWEQARALCSARSKRLCSEEEWEKACKGGQEARYPYGNQFSASSCNTKGARGSGKAAGSGTFEGCRSDYDVFDMSGNLKEWTSSNWAENVADKVVRGGSFSRPDWATRCSFRENFKPDFSDEQLGFRCCSDL